MLATLLRSALEETRTSHHRTAHYRLTWAQGGKEGGKELYGGEGARADESKGARADESKGARAAESKGARADESKGARAAESKGARADESKGARAAESQGARAAESQGARAAESKGARAAESKGARAAESKEWLGRRRRLHSTNAWAPCDRGVGQDVVVSLRCASAPSVNYQRSGSGSHKVLYVLVNTVLELRVLISRPLALKM